jgi:hypothetical protein
MSSTSSIAVLEKTACVLLNVSLWTGRRRLRAQDLGEAAQKLPPDDLASLGSLKLCNPKRLGEIASIKRAAERECKRKCAAFLGGYATDIDNLSGLVTKLQALQTRFNKEATDFANDLQAEIDRWTALHPQWKAIIEDKVPDAANVRGRFEFKFQAFRVGAASADPLDPVNAGLEDAANGLSGQLFAEIEAEAREAWKSSYEGKDCVGQKALRPLKAILSKLEALRYLDARCQPVIDQFTKVLGSLPKHGPIADPHLSAVIGLFRVVESGKALRARGAALLKNRDAGKSDLFADADESGTRPAVPEQTVQPGPAPSVSPPKSDPRPPSPPARGERGAIWF